MVTGELSELERFRAAITTEQGGIEILSRLVPVPASSSASEFWGSKWGDCDTAESDCDGLDEFGYLLWFSSAWSPPVDGITKVSELFPSLLFELQFEEGGMDFCGASVARAGESAVVKFSMSGDVVGIDWSSDGEPVQGWDSLSDAVNELKARAAVEALEELNANSGEFWHDGNDWKHCERVVYSGDLWAECTYCGAVMSWDDDEIESGSDDE